MRTRFLFIGMTLLLLQRPGVSVAGQDAVMSDSLSPARVSIAPLPIIFYTPETNTAIGALVSIFRRSPGSTDESRPSTLTPVFIYTIEKQIIVEVSGGHYWDDEANNVNAGFSYVKFPGLFYGIGNDVSNDDDENYTTESYSVNVGYLRRVRPHLRVGGEVAFGHSRLLEREEGGLLAAGTIAGTEDGKIFGPGIRVDFDDRNHITYPTSGGWSTLGFQIFDGALGSDYDFRSVQLESRRYFGAGGSRVFACRALLNYVDGQVPFQVLPALGGDSVLRGYFGGRFRDRSLAVLDVEYRQHVWWRLGFVAFAGAGQVARTPDKFALNDLHPAGGVGLRFRFIEAERLNLRIDLGWGEDDSGTYISLGEAF